ncbi:MAG: hypothetical protein P8N50_02385 [Actinomycetota bacterium]|jgi:hypothetical protein|nr:hypothetical protein [Actinomycetota bacterium]
MKLFGYDIDRDAAVRGSLATALIVIPLAIVIGRVIDDESNWQVPLTFAVLAGFVAGGAVAGRRSPLTPAVHGAITAVPCLLVVTMVAVASRAFGEGDVSLGLIISQIVVGSSLGMLGGAAAARFGDKPTPLTR